MSATEPNLPAYGPPTPPDATRAKTALLLFARAPARERKATGLRQGDAHRLHHALLLKTLGTLRAAAQGAPLLVSTDDPRALLPHAPDADPPPTTRRLLRGQAPRRPPTSRPARPRARRPGRLRHPQPVPVGPRPRPRRPPSRPRPFGGRRLLSLDPRPNSHPRPTRLALGPRRPRRRPLTRACGDPPPQAGEGGVIAQLDGSLRSVLCAPVGRIAPTRLHAHT
jgi:hypothetical protein